MELSNCRREEEKKYTRMCVDYRALNEETSRPIFPIPAAEEIFEYIDQLRYFSKYQSLREIVKKRRLVHDMASMNSIGCRLEFVKPQQPFRC